jgi:hypothetical protein
MVNQHPEQLARDKIDQKTPRSGLGWCRTYRTVNLGRAWE